MKTMFARLKSSFILFVVGLSLVGGSQALAQTSTIEYEEAKLISKFAKHVSWPAEAIQQDFIIGVYEDTEKLQYFTDYYENKGVKNKDIVVRLVSNSTEAKDVNILYIPENKRSFLTTMYKKMKGSSVLVVTEDANELYKTMIDISYNRDDSKMVFRVNDANIDDTNLTIPELSLFLGSANEEEVLSISPTFARKNEEAKQLLALQNTIAQQKAALNQLNKNLNASKKSSAKYASDLKKESANLKSAQQETTKLSKSVAAQNVKLQNLEKKLEDQKAQLAMSKDDLQVLDQEKIKAQEESIAQLTEDLKKQKNLANSNANKLSTLKKDNEALSGFEMLFYVFVVIAIIALLIAFVMWKKSKAVVSAPAAQGDNESQKLLPLRENQLIKSENLTALGYIATDITYAVGLSLGDLQAQLESAGDTKNANTLKPMVTLLENFNLIAADQDENELQSFNLISYIEKMMMLYDFEFSQSDIVYTYSGEKALTIKSVPSYIALVLLHLINNSLKHGFDNNGNGKINLNVEKGAKSGAIITYSDDGKGMNKSTLEQAFKPFFTTRGDRDYVGVGMSNTYDLIKKKLAGDIKLDSKEGKGTTVTITLP